MRPLLRGPGARSDTAAAASIRCAVQAAAAEAAVREAREAGEKEALGRLVEVLYCSAVGAQGIWKRNLRESKGIQGPRLLPQHLLAPRPALPPGMRCTRLTARGAVVGAAARCFILPSPAAARPPCARHAKEAAPASPAHPHASTTDNPPHCFCPPCAHEGSSLPCPCSHMPPQPMPSSLLLPTPSPCSWWIPLSTPTWSAGTPSCSRHPSSWPTPTLRCAGCALPAVLCVLRAERFLLRGAVPADVGALRQQGLGGLHSSA